jgi:CHASE1-domain containing sensor protein
MENRKQNRWSFLSLLKKQGIIILVVCLLSLSVAVAATIHYLGKAQSLTTATHTAGAAVNPVSQQSTQKVSPGVGKTQQPLITVSSSDVTVDFGNRQTTTYPIPSTFLGVGGLV